MSFRKSVLLKVEEVAAILAGLLDAPTVCERLTVYVPTPPVPVPNAVMKVAPD